MTNLEEQGIWELKGGRHEREGRTEALKACLGTSRKNLKNMTHLAPVLYTDGQGCVRKVEETYGTLYTFQKQEFPCLSLYAEC